MRDALVAYAGTSEGFSFMSIGCAALTVPWCSVHTLVNYDSMPLAT